jgi:hypothetical protein
MSEPQEYITPAGNVITIPAVNEPQLYAEPVPYFATDEAAELRALIANPNTSWRDRTNASARLRELERQRESERLDEAVREREAQSTGTLAALTERIAQLTAEVAEVTRKLGAKQQRVTNVPRTEPAYVPVRPYYAEQ